MHTHAFTLVLPYIYGLVALLDNIQLNFSSITISTILLRYGSWGEPCACILWYREERRRKTRDIWTRRQPPCIRSATYLRHKYTCSSQFAENVSPRSNRLGHGALPSMNEPVRSVLHELTGANCAQTKVTITLIAKWCIHEICVIYRSFTSWSPIYHIFNIDRVVVKKHRFSAILAVCLKAAKSIFKIL